MQTVMNDAAQAALKDTQLAIEAEALDMGVARYQKARQQDETSTRPGLRLLVEAVKPLTGAIREWVDEVTSGKPTINANVGYFLQDVDAEVVAYLTARRCIAAMVKRETLQTVAFGIASMIEDAVNFDKLRDENPRAYRLLQRKIAKSSDPGYRHVVMRKQQKYAGVRAIKWGRNEKLAMGLLLVELMEANVILNGEPLFTGTLQSLGARMEGPNGQTSRTERKSNTNGRARVSDARYILVPTETCAKWLEGSHARCEALEPVHMPMVVEPRPWTTPMDGGYLSKKMGYALLKTRNRKAYLDELANYEMPKVYGAVNALQSTEWRVNKAVLGVMRESWEQGLQIAGLPPRDLLPLPPNAPDNCTDEELAQVKAEKARIHAENVRLMSKRLSMGAKLWLGEKFSTYERIYFPHALDWRGRAYPVASYLHPQADDTGKALLEFARGVPLGDNGAYWLAVHGANCYGVDKVSFDERAQWVLDHEDEILASAMEPFARGAFWTQTDEAPWRFLAFCFEWAGYVTGGRSEEFVSHTPVAFDGSCNGLQHYSMMLRDEVGGAATNLVPADKPSDIYTRVAAELEKIVAGSTHPEAAQWRGKITRKIAKQPTMTMPYGAGQFGYRQQIMDALKKSERDTGKAHIAGDSVWAASGYLAGEMKGALAGVVVKAAEAMEWLQKASHIASEDGLPIRWEAPNGLPVLQDYRTMVGERFDREVLGQRIQLMLTREGQELDKRRQAQGIAPNFVHSLDASHMMETVMLALDHGIEDFAMVHDSYGAHAGHADSLNRLLREAFVKMYSGDVLGRFRDALVAQLSPKLAAKIPPLPAFGSLDPEAVKDSQYFFA